MGTGGQKPPGPRRAVPSTGLAFGTELQEMVLEQVMSNKSRRMSHKGGEEVK